ncbi:MAG: hypothetical protein HY884_00795 [Deltaproteobacteria bacterium]|nr:hypothetical protein [Deltaproteobacteria bacterium]
MNAEDKKTFYLVSPFHQNPSGRSHHFWMLDEGQKWNGVARGIWRPKHSDDLVTGSALALHLTELDWTRTPFHDNRLKTGWVSRDGRFYGCPEKYHDTLAFCVLGVKVADLETLGWVRVQDSNRFVCEQRLSAEQKNYLTQNGFRVPEGF